MQPGFTLRLTNRLLELDCVADAVDAFGEAHALAPKLRFQIRLVLDELLTNIIAYGYPATEEGGHDITVDMQQEGTVLRFSIADDACPFDPLAAKAPDLDSAIEDRRVGGLGIHLVRTIMDRVAYERIGDGNHLILEKDIER